MTADSAKSRPLILLQTAPYDGSLARSSLDLALSFAVFAQQPQLLFCGAGVLCLSAHQHPDAIGRKSLRKVIDSLPMYDLETIFVDAGSLEMNGLNSAHLPGFAVVLDARQV
ncbi:MAG: DsrE family protein, partial [Congregibacter sp.]|nr:DsrE family protein [Congregibacter sp.]